MKYYQKILTQLFIFISFSAPGQTPEIDSLMNELTNVKEDTNKALLLGNLGYKLAPYDSENALQYAKLGVYLSEKLGYIRGRAECYKSIGVIYYYQQDFEQALENYYKSLNLSLELKDNVLSSNTILNIGSIYFYQGNYDLALEKYLESLELKEKIGNDLEIAKVLNNLSILYQEQGKYNLALENYLRCLQIYETSNDLPGIARTTNNIGITFMYQGIYDRALDYFFESLTDYEELGDSINSAYTYLNIGQIYEYQEEFDKAQEYYEKSIPVFEAYDDQYTLAEAYYKVGNIYKVKEDFEKALEYLFISLSITEEIGDRVGIGFIYDYIGQTYYKKNEYSKALDYLFKSLKISQENGDVNHIGTTSFIIGNIYFELNNFNKALQYFKNTKKISEEIGALESEKNAAEGLSKTYAKLGQYKKAYENHVLYKKLFDQLKSDENIKNIAQREMQYEFDKKQKQQEFEQAQKEAAYQAELKRQRLIRTIFVIGFVFVLIFAFFIARSYRIIKKANVLLAEQRDQIAQQKEAITDSIIYAKRIQTAVLPSPDYASEILSEHFILFKPRDIVSGDFFWMTQRENKSIVVAADCTGHGVPGAFMSMLGVSFLNEIVNKKETAQANLILNELRDAVKRTLDQTGKKDEAKDGMDLALCMIDYHNSKLQYAGAYNPLYLYRKGELMETKADKMPIGIHVKEKDCFTNHEIDLQKGDTFYIFSDGFVDQFGGENGGKFKSKKFKTLLAEIQDKNLSDQKEILDRTIEEWRGTKFEQLDDICVIGIRI